MDTTVIITIIFLLLMLIATLVLVYIESRKRIKRLEGRIERLSSRIQSMSMKELDTVLKSIEYKKERDELYELIEGIYSTSEALEDGRQVKLLPRTHLDKTNRVMTYKWQDGDTRYTSYYTYNPSHTDTQTGSHTDSTSSQDSSSYSGGGGDFSGGGSGGSWD